VKEGLLVDLVNILTLIKILEKEYHEKGDILMPEEEIIVILEDCVE
jgi:hypothetical protein